MNVIAKKDLLFCSNYNREDKPPFPNIETLYFGKTTKISERTSLIRNHFLIFYAMSTNSSSSLENLLLLTNLEIIGTQVRLSEIVHKFEGGGWNDAQRKASMLVKTNTAMSYLDDVRKTVGVYEPKLNLPVHQEETTESAKPIMEVKPFEKSSSENDIFEENYRLLNKFAPELEEELQRLTENEILSGKSATNLYGSASIKSIKKDKYGHFISLEINESAKPSQSILLYLNATAKTVKVLSVESSDWKFDVYNDIDTRELVNPEQEELQNKYLGEHIKRLIKSKLSIPTIEVVATQEPEQKENSSIEFQFPRRGLSYPKPDPNREWVPYNEDDKDDIEYDDEPDYDDLVEENRVLREENEELKQEQDFVLNSVFPTLYAQNFKLLRLLIPDLAEEFKGGSDRFTAFFESQKPTFPKYKIDFRILPHRIICDIFELDEQGNTDDIECEFAIEDKSSAYFVFSGDSFLTLKKSLHAGDHDEVSEIGLEVNTALNNFFLTLLFHNYQSTIKDRVFKAETIENPPVEIQQVEESDGTGAVVAVLATIGLGILGFRLFK